MKCFLKVDLSAAAAVLLLLGLASSAVVTSPHHHHSHGHHHHSKGAYKAPKAGSDSDSLRGTPATQVKAAEEHTDAAKLAAVPPTDPIHKEIHEEVASMEKQISELHDVTDAMQFAGKIASMEEELGRFGEAAEGVELMDRINTVRVNLCVNHHLIAAELKDCQSFMQRACQPASDRKESALPLPKVNPSQCHQFLMHKETRVYDEKKDERAGADADEDSAGPAPAPYGAAAPAASPLGEADERGLTAADIAQAKRIWTQGGKLSRPMPSQGFSGDDVSHNYMHTMTADWQEEFGPAANHKSFTTVCKEHPDNEWCRLHGYYEPKKARAPDTLWGMEYGNAHRNFGPVLLIMCLLAALCF